MNLFPSIFHESGGMVYHWRALFNQSLKKLWAPHQAQTRAFLEEWNPSAQHLYLVGPSGGYSLPKEWLRRFSSITAFEPDPVARRIFELRMGIRPSWITTPFEFAKVKSEEISFRPNSAILFCNLLGQINFDEDSGLLAQSVLEKLAITHPLASYHDALSGDHFRFEWESPRDGDAPVRVKYEMEALDPYFAANEGVTELDLHLHPAAYLFQEPEPFRYQYWEWRITPTQTHVIEGVYSNPLKKQN